LSFCSKAILPSLSTAWPTPIPSLFCLIPLVCDFSLPFIWEFDDW
jgi:hypothetical protein